MDKKKNAREALSVKTNGHNRKNFSNRGAQCAGSEWSAEEDVYAGGHEQTLYAAKCWCGVVACKLCVRMARKMSSGLSIHRGISLDYYSSVSRARWVRIHI